MVLANPTQEERMSCTRSAYLLAPSEFRQPLGRHRRQVLGLEDEQ